MTCAEFQRSLDEGIELSQLTSHAAICTDCARELRAAMELERALAIPIPAKVSVDFNDAVMRRIHENSWLSALTQTIADPTIPVTLALTIILGIEWRALASLTIDAALVLAPIVFAISWRLFRSFERITSFGEESST